MKSSPSTEQKSGSDLPGRYHANSQLDVQRSYINGAYQSNQSGDTFATLFPGNNNKICDVEIAAHSEVDAAVAAAKSAFAEWHRTPAAERAGIQKKPVKFCWSEMVSWLNSKH